MLGKLEYAAKIVKGGEVISETIGLYQLFMDGFNLGKEIATVASKPKLPQSYVPPKSSTSILPYAIGGAAIVAGGGGAVYYIIKEETEELEDFGSYSGGLSDVTVNSRNITITVYDHEIIDNDQIDLIVNGKTVLNDFILGPPPGKTVNVTLDKGENIVSVHADNEGDLTPNTAAIVISNVVSGLPEQVWELGLGEDASFTIAYDSKAAPRLQPTPINYNLNVPLNETTRAYLGYYDNQIGNRHLGLNIRKKISDSRFYMVGYRQESYRGYDVKSPRFIYRSNDNTLLNSSLLYDFEVENTLDIRQGKKNSRIGYANSSALYLSAKHLNSEWGIQPDLNIRQIFDGDGSWSSTFAGNFNFYWNLSRRVQLTLGNMSIVEKRKTAQLGVISNVGSLGVNCQLNRSVLGSELIYDLPRGKITGFAQYLALNVIPAITYQYSLYSDLRTSSFSSHALRWRFVQNYSLDAYYSNLPKTFLLRVNRGLNPLMREIFSSSDSANSFMAIGNQLSHVAE